MLFWNVVLSWICGHGYDKTQGSQNNFGRCVCVAMLNVFLYNHYELACYLIMLDRE